MKPPVLLAAAGAAWEAPLLAALERPGASVVVARRCVDVVDLLAVAATGQGRAAVLAASLRRLDADAVDRLHASGVVPVAVLPAGDPGAAARVRALGIRHSVGDDAGPEPLIATVLLALGAGAGTAESARSFGDPAGAAGAQPESGGAAGDGGASRVPAPGGRPDGAGPAPAAEPTSPPAANRRSRRAGVRGTGAPPRVQASARHGAGVSRTRTSGPADAARAGRAGAGASQGPQPRRGHGQGLTSAPRRGSVIAVWGPTGAPGRTTVSIGLADEFAEAWHRADAAPGTANIDGGPPTDGGGGALLVDADVYGGTVAAALGLLDESPGLAAACRLAAGTPLDGAALAGLCWQLRPGMRVLTGVPLAARWTELRPAAISAVLDAARTLADQVVVDCGFSVEADEELSFDSLAPRRNGATLAVLDAADHVVVVGAADPIGMQRLVRALTELSDAGVRAPRTVVLNKVRRSAVPGDTRVELVDALRLFAGASPAALLPYDREALDTALATGRSLREAHPGSALRRAFAELATVFTGTAPRSRRGPIRRVGSAMMRGRTTEGGA